MVHEVPHHWEATTPNCIVKACPTFLIHLKLPVSKEGQQVLDTLKGSTIGSKVKGSDWTLCTWLVSWVECCIRLWVPLPSVTHLCLMKYICTVCQQHLHYWKVAPPCCIKYCCCWLQERTIKWCNNNYKTPNVQCICSCNVHASFHNVVDAYKIQWHVLLLLIILGLWFTYCSSCVYMHACFTWTLWEQSLLWHTCLLIYIASTMHACECMIKMHISRWSGNVRLKDDSTLSPGDVLWTLPCDNSTFTNGRWPLKASYYCWSWLQERTKWN